jgi:hypothetical protein
MQTPRTPIPPLGVPSSVFEMGRQAKPVPVLRKRTPLPENIEIKSGIPVPEAQTGKRGDLYAPILHRMQPGDMVELCIEHSRSMLKRAKALGIKATSRTLPNGKTGVWRLE